MRWIAAVNQDPGIGPGRNKGAAVHLHAMRAAFEELGFEVAALDLADDRKLRAALDRLCSRGLPEFIYERYALGKDCASRFACERRIPLVLEANAPLADESARYRRRPESDGERERDRFVFSSARLVAAVSSAVAEYAIYRGADPGRVMVCPNGIDQKRFRPDVRKARVALPGIAATSTVLGFHGRERPWHAFDHLVEATCRLLDDGHDVHFLAIGEGSFEALERLPRSRYTRLPWQPHERIPRLLGNVDVLPVAHQSEAPYYFSPLKLTEAMACGVVPVVPHLGDLASTVRHGRTGLVYPAGRVERLTSEIARLCASPALRESLAAKAAAWAAEQTWTAIACRMLSRPELASTSDCRRATECL